MKQYLILSLLFIITASCTMTDFIYNINKPNKVIELPKKLNEVSGLEYIAKDTLVCVQDEIGTIFFINTKDGEIYDEIEFEKKGDFEGIAKYKNKYYVLRSDGTLFRVSRNGKSKEYKFKDGKEYDFEGLCLDVVNNRLLIACKEHSKSKKKHLIHIFEFSLTDKEYLKDPVFVVDKEETGKGFSASGIAIHPSGNMFVLSAASNQMLELTPEAEVRAVIDLTNQHFNQAEGICFGENGELYISNEKGKGKGIPNVMIFEPR